MKRWDSTRLTVYYWPGDWLFGWESGARYRVLNVGPWSFWLAR